MHVLPALQRKQLISRFRTTVENRNIIEAGCILNPNLRMLPLQIRPQSVVHLGIPGLYHHQRLPIQIRYLQLFLPGQRMLPGNGAHLPVAAQWKHAALVQPASGVADRHQKIKFFAKPFDLRKDPLMIILKGYEMQPISREIPVYPIPEIHKGFCRIQQRGTHTKGGIIGFHGLLRILNGFLGKIKEEPGVPVDHFSCRCQTNAVGRPLDQLQIQMCLQRVHLLHDGSRGDIELRCRSGKASAIRYTDKNGKLTVIHVFPPVTPPAA